MAELIAVGKEEQHRWWQTIPEGVQVLLGRAPRNGWSVPWDWLISREHAYLCLSDGKLQITQLETARNPVLFQNRPAKNFLVEPGGEFRIGETVFRFEVAVAEDRHNATIVEHTLTDPLSPRQFANANACLEALCRLPAVISETGVDADLAYGMVRILLQSLSGATAVAVMQFEATEANAPIAESPKLLRWDSRDPELKRFRPSRRLITRAFERQQSVVHLWSQRDDDPEFTMTCDLDWAFCTPIPVAAGELWCLYVSGKQRFKGMKEIQSPSDLIAELRLAELMGQFLGAVRKVRSLEQQQINMRQFFSPAVIEQLSSQLGVDSLEPQIGPVSVLFCDVRGFSRKVEQSQDNLPQLLGVVSQALSVMTGNILKFEGVIADFQGDAALGFWGWPSKADDSALLACRAALAINQVFAAANGDPQHPLCGFQIGIGLGHGDAIAGRIGSQDQIKVGVFGPVVNLSSRLQDLTKRIGVSILIDKTTAAAFVASPDQGDAICRPVGRLRPAGVETCVDAFALAPAGGPGWLEPAQIDQFAQAVAHVIAGQWSSAIEVLQALPIDDGPTQFLLESLSELGGQPPADWDGALNLTREGHVV
jgi:adenylate cyclase